MICRNELPIASDPTTASTLVLDLVFRKAGELVAELADAVTARQSSQRLFARVENELATLPLAADEYALIRCRLQNAWRYSDQGEIGAANFELRLMARCLGR